MFQIVESTHETQTAFSLFANNYQLVPFYELFTFLFSFFPLYIEKRVPLFLTKEYGIPKHA